jgi:hypothetical protein
MSFVISKHVSAPCRIVSPLLRWTQNFSLQKLPMLLLDYNYWSCFHCWLHLLILGAIDFISCLCPQLLHFLVVYRPQTPDVILFLLRLRVQHLLLLANRVGLALVILHLQVSRQQSDQRLSCCYVCYSYLISSTIGLRSLNGDYCLL